MADYTGIFERVEQKYLLDSLQFEALWAVWSRICAPMNTGAPPYATFTLTPRIICWRDFRAKSRL